MNIRHHKKTILICLFICLSTILISSIFIFKQIHSSTYAADQPTFSRYLGGWLYNDNAHNAASMDTYIGEFKADTDPLGTYYCMGQWYLNTDETLAGKIPASTTDGVSGNNEIMSAYGGLQNKTNTDAYGNTGKVSIIAFWDVNYRDTEGGEIKSIRAETVYPYNKGHDFGGEGVGSNDFEQYNWETGKWYRMAIHSWQDQATGKTFVGQWFQDLSTGTWTLTSYFNTKLTNSFIDYSRNAAIFSENYDKNYAQSIRKSSYKNFYVKGNGNNNWYPLSRARLHVSFTESQKRSIGTSEFGLVDDSSFYMIADGTQPSDPSTYNNSYTTYNLTQPSTPNNLSSPSYTYSFSYTDNNASIQWTPTSTSSPQESFEMTITDLDTNNVVSHTKTTRPEINNFTYNDIVKNYSFTLTIKDIFGQTTTQTFTSTPATLSFDANSGTGIIDPQTCYSSTTCTVTIPATKPNRSNHTFLGWATTNDANTATYFPESQITLDKAGSKEPVSLKLYAVWEPNESSNESNTPQEDDEEFIPIPNTSKDSQSDNNTKTTKQAPDTGSSTKQNTNLEPIPIYAFPVIILVGLIAFATIKHNRHHIKFRTKK